MKVGKDGREAGYHSIVVARDDLSGWVEARALFLSKAPYIVSFFREEIIYRHGCPAKVVSDGGSEFCAEFEDFCVDMGIELIHGSAHHPRTYGMIERGHQPLLNTLSKLQKGDPTNWPDRLPALLWADRITAKRTTGYTPFELVYGRDAIEPIHLVKETWDSVVSWPQVRTTKQLLKARMDQVEFAEDARLSSQRRVDEARTNSAADCTAGQQLRPELQVLTNDSLVLLHRTHKENQHGDKLCFCWSGPFRIHKEPEQFSWRLFELNGTPIAGTFAEDRLKPFHSCQHQRFSTDLE